MNTSNSGQACKIPIFAGTCSSSSSNHRSASLIIPPQRFPLFQAPPVDSPSPNAQGTLPGSNLEASAQLQLQLTAASLHPPQQLTRASVRRSGWFWLHEKQPLWKVLHAITHLPAPSTQAAWA